MKLQWPLFLLIFSLINTIQIAAMNGDSIKTTELEEQQAEQGHVESMMSCAERQLELSGFDEEMQRTNPMLKEENFQNALQWFVLAFIRAEQDAACYGNKKVVNKITKSIKNHPSFQLINKSITKKEFAEKVKEQIEWVKRKTSNNELPPPTWITGYFNKNFNSSPQAIPESEWQNKRLWVLQIIKEESTSVN